MRSLTRMLAVFALVAALPIVAFADEAPATADTTAADSVALMPQSVCPVMGNKIDSTVFADVQGQRLYFCCPMCPPKVKADPDKYFKQAAADGVLFENVQTACPVTGEKLEEKKVFTDYDGRRVYFCCKRCVSDFTKNPDEYLPKLGLAPTKEAGDETPMQDMH